VSLPHLDNAAARAIFLDRHALWDTPQGEAHGPALLDLITKLGFVQLDSINTVARAHDLILFARRPRYRPKMLRTLYEKDRALFEHWTHDASVVPMAFYPWWRMRMQRDAAELIKRWRNWRRDGFESQFDTVLRHIRENGPCCSSDVGTDEKKGSGGWWDWHPSKTALEYLWMSGALTVTKRVGFRKFYDLTERVIETHARNDVPSDAETIDWCCQQALDRLGFATSGELAAFWRHATPQETKAWCTDALARGEIMEMTIGQVDGKPRKVFARPDIVDDPALDRPAPSRLRVLSPFDPALRDRNRARRLFGFDYTIEMFVPAAKRKWGYYVYPILEGDRFVGRIEVKADRKAGKLRVINLWREPKVKWTPARANKTEAELARMLRFVGLQEVVWDIPQPTDLP